MMWTTLASRRISGSPGSDEWQEFLCIRRVAEGFEIAICGYELDEDGNESDELVEDQNFDSKVIDALDQAQLAKACEALHWSGHVQFPPELTP